jgi:hypothetical protein
MGEQSFHMVKQETLLSRVPRSSLTHKKRSNNNLSQVSSDAAISIAFGLISTLIGLVGAIINYLTLRAMTLEIGTTSQLYP